MALPGRAVLARRLSEDQQAQRRRESEQVRDMVENHAGWRVLKKRLDDRTDQVLREIVEGRLCHDDYRSYTGELKGLRRIDALIDRLLSDKPGGPEDV